MVNNNGDKLPFFTVINLINLPLVTMHWKCNFIESISVFISLFVCLFSFLLIELILNNVICKFSIQHVDVAMGIIENSYGEDLHYLLWRMAALCSFSCISGGKCENSWDVQI